MEGYYAIYLMAVIVVRGLIIWWCVDIAKKKGRDALTAGLLGLIFGLWAVIGYAIVNKKSRISESLNPLCPKCESDTILRTVLRGKDKGKKFYVCSNYPQCKGRIKA